jgi:hypothetical protein
MTCPTFLSDALGQLGGVRQVGDVLLVDTHCLYPSGSVVQVAVQGGAREAVVHDNGGTSEALSQHGVHYHQIDAALRRFARSRDLRIDNGQIASPPVTTDILPVAILMVANASKEAADELLRKYRFSKKKDFREQLDFFFQKNFGTKRYKRDYEVFGQSEKKYKFDHAILGDNKVILVDAVLPDPSSLYASVVANLDVRESHDPRYIQRIVYDENDLWRSQDLRLLQTGAPVVPYKHAEDEISSLADAA